LRVRIKKKKTRATQLLIRESEEREQSERCAATRKKMIKKWKMKTKTKRS
jgi:hypothetical protein